eukprot:10624936-Lingulodinium_polyedra.AAC.1
MRSALRVASCSALRSGLTPARRSALRCAFAVGGMPRVALCDAFCGAFCGELCVAFRGVFCGA